jgi:hypothetical protein
VRSTQELWQGANYWYYPGGNALAKDKNTSNDPKLGPSGGMQLGYAAVCSAGAECSGNITVAEIDKVRNKTNALFLQQLQFLLLSFVVENDDLKINLSQFSTTTRSKSGVLFHTHRRSMTTARSRMPSSWVRTAPFSR